MANDIELIRLQRSVDNLIDELETHKYFMELFGRRVEVYSSRWKTLPDAEIELIKAYDKLAGVRRDYKTGEILTQAIA